MRISSKHFLFQSALVLIALQLLASPANAWWNKDWSARKKFTIDTTSTGAEITDPIGSAVVLVRLHQGNFDFMSAKEDGGDIRFVTEDDKTVLPFHIEKYDSLMNEAYVWVKVPDIKPGAQTNFWIYSGNAGDATEDGPDSKKTYDPDFLMVYHLGENATPPADFTDKGNNAENAGVPSQGALIGAGLRLLGKPVTIPATPSLEIKEGGTLTWSAWIKASSLQPNAVLFTRGSDSNNLTIGLENGAPYVEVVSANGKQHSPAGEAVAVNTWKHLAAVAENSTVTLYVDGLKYGTIDAALPALNDVSFIGGTSSGENGFIGEIDELQISKSARTPGAIKFEAISQGVSESAGKLVFAGENEGGHAGGNEMLEHLSLFGDIAKNMMFDGWVVIFCCAIMAIVGWVVAIKKFLYLRSIKKGTEEFLRQWADVATDLTALDHTDKDNVKSFGGKASPKMQKQMHSSPLFHIYHIGSEEIRHRLQNARGFNGLSARSIQAIRASLDGGLTREVHKMNDGMIFLTISIAGGPYVGLLGTVMGVMITFAVIAKSGEVEVNSIAPGIASALLATVAGLVVAIPALFIYSYLSSQVKNAVSTMQMFIDEFVTKMAEFYPTPGEGFVPVPKQEIDPSPTVTPTEVRS